VAPLYMAFFLVPNTFKIVLPGLILYAQFLLTFAVNEQLFRNSFDRNSTFSKKRNWKMKVNIFENDSLCNSVKKFCELLNKLKNKRM